MSDPEEDGRALVEAIDRMARTPRTTADAEALAEVKARYLEVVKQRDSYLDQMKTHGAERLVAVNRAGKAEQDRDWWKTHADEWERTGMNALAMANKELERNGLLQAELEVIAGVLIAAGFDNARFKSCPVDYCPANSVIVQCVKELRESRDTLAVKKDAAEKRLSEVEARNLELEDYIQARKGGAVKI